jgi:hypothetical protein
MGSDRANPGAPNLNGQNGPPQAQGVEQKHWPGRPLICYNVVFSPQNPGNDISETLDSNIFVWARPGPLENSCIYGAQLVRLALLLGGGPSKFLNRGPPDITLRHWLFHRASKQNQIGKVAGLLVKSGTLEHVTPEQHHSGIRNTRTPKILNLLKIWGKKLPGVVKFSCR